MSFFRNPQLFLGHNSYSKDIKMLMVRAKLGDPIDSTEVDSIGPVHFTHHLFLGDNKASDFEYFFDYLNNFKDFYVNCQGSMLRCSGRLGISYTWLTRTIDTSIYGLPAQEDPRAKEKELAIKLDACMEEANRQKSAKQFLENEKRALENEIRNLETKNSTLKDEKVFLQQTVSGLHGKICALESEVQMVRNEKNSLIIDLNVKSNEILTLYKKEILSLKAKSFTLECEMERAKNENDLCKEDTREAKEFELEALKTELGE